MSECGVVVRAEACGVVMRKAEWGVVKNVEA